jgi:Peptidase S24-like
MATFSENLTNQRFRQVYDVLIKNKKIKNKQQLAQQLDTYNHVINLCLKGERNITVEQMNRLCEIHHINANFLFGKSDMIFLNDAKVLPIHTDNDTALRRNNITLVPYKAAAGYAMNPGDWHFLDSLQKFSIPGLEGNLTAFEISGDSMLPTITNGDVVVCEPLERGEPLRDNQVYVVVTDVVVAKRIQQVKKNGTVTHLRLISDNGDVYLPYEVSSNEVQQILRVKCRLTNHAIA